MATLKSQTPSEELRNVWDALTQLKADLLVLKTMIRSRRARAGVGKTHLKRGRKLGVPGRISPAVRSSARRASPRTSFDPAVAESHYQALGRWKGPMAVASIQDAAREFWRSAGPEGADWLVRRLRSETHVEPLHAAASTLADMGSVAIPPILEELDHSPAPEQALALLKGLGWMALDQWGYHRSPDPSVRIVAGFLQSRDPETREAAAEAIQIVAPDHAAAWLEARLDVEKNEDVVETIQNVLTKARRPGA